LDSPFWWAGVLIVGMFWMLVFRRGWYGPSSRCWEAARRLAQQEARRDARQAAQRRAAAAAAVHSTASMSNSSPGDYATTDVLVQTSPGAAVSATAH
jgi:hypothetical protein